MLVVLSAMIIDRIFSVVHIPDILGLKPWSVVPALVWPANEVCSGPDIDGSRFEPFLVSPSCIICNLFKKLNAFCIVFTFADKSALCM